MHEMKEQAVTDQDVDKPGLQKFGTKLAAIVELLKEIKLQDCFAAGLGRSMSLTFHLQSCTVLFCSVARAGREIQNAKIALFSFRS